MKEKKLLFQLNTLCEKTKQEIIKWNLETSKNDNIIYEWRATINDVEYAIFIQKLINTNLYWYNFSVRLSEYRTLIEIQGSSDKPDGTYFDILQTLFNLITDNRDIEKETPTNSLDTILDYLDIKCTLPIK